MQFFYLKQHKFFSFFKSKSNIKKEKIILTRDWDKYRALTDTNYGSNYNKIFENNGLELDKQISAINKLDIYSSNKLSSKIDYKNGNNKFFQDSSFINNISRCSQDNRNFLCYQSNNIGSMADYDIL